MNKYIFFVLIVLVAVVADQVTKQWAEARLANNAVPPALVDGPKFFDIKVDESGAGKTVKEYLLTDLTGTTPKEVENIAYKWTLVDGVRPSGTTMKLKGGETLTIQRRTVEVVEDFFHFRYTRNPGAAFSFMAKQDESFRKPFFIFTSFFAVLFVIFLYRKVEEDQRLLKWALSLIVGGAVGNLIDRLLYGWVIDFIDWHYYRHYTWPTFNIADTAIVIGVGLLGIQIIHDIRNPPPEDDEEEPPASKDSNAPSAAA